MDTKKLDKWADLLLDTGKRNNLINFKDTRASTVEVLLPSSDVLFEKVDGTASFEVFDPKIVEEDDDTEEPYAPEQLQIGALEESSEPEQLQIAWCQKRPMLLAAKLHFWLNIPVKSSGRIKSYFIMPQRIHLLP